VPIKDLKGVDLDIANHENGLKKMRNHLSQAEAAIKRREDHVKELEPLVKTQHGLAKSELEKVVVKLKEKAKSLAEYVKKGQAEIKEREKLLAASK